MLYFSTVTMKDQNSKNTYFYRRTYEKSMQIILTKGNSNTNSCHDACARQFLKPKLTIKQTAM